MGGGQVGPFFFWKDSISEGIGASEVLGAQNDATEVNEQDMDKWQHLLPFLAINGNKPQITPYMA